MNEASIKERLDKVISIFRYLEDKDVFEGFYKMSLAKRLLGNYNHVKLFRLTQYQ